MVRIIQLFFAFLELTVSSKFGYVLLHFYSLALEHSSEFHAFTIIVIYEMGWQSKVTGYGLRNWDLTSGGIIFFSPSPQHTLLVLYQSVIQLSVKPPECASDHAPQFSTETKTVLHITRIHRCGFECSA
jgi:hypothetical protein